MNFRKAVEAYNLDRVKELLPGATSNDLIWAMNVAVAKNYGKLAEVLFPQVYEINYELLRCAVYDRLHEVVRVSLKYIDPSEELLGTAARNGDVEMVKLLAPRVKRTEYAIGAARRYGHTGVVKVLQK